MRMSHQHDVGLERLRELYRLDAIGGLARDLQVLGRVDDHLEAGSDELLVVGQQHPDAHAPGSSGSRAKTR
jgi:hypothetical protein